MKRLNRKADAGRDSCRQCCAEHPHAERKNEEIVEEDVRNAAAEHRGHRKAGRSVVSQECKHQIIQKIGGSKEQDRAQIFHCHPDHRPVGSEQGGERVRRGQTGGQKGRRHQGRKAEGVRKDILPGGPVPRLRDGITGCASHPRHQAEAVHQAVGGQRQIQSGQPRRAAAPRDEKRVRKNIAGKSDHPQNIGGHIGRKRRQRPAVFFGQGFCLPP